MTLQEGMDEDRKRERAEINAPDTEQLASSSAERNVGARKVVHGGLGEHGIVLKLGLAERGAVAGNKHKLGCVHVHAHTGKEWKDDGQHKGPSQPHAPVPGEREGGRDAPLPLRICLRADL